MARLLVHVEGETEETFVNEMLGRHLVAHGTKASARGCWVMPVSAPGAAAIRSWISARKDIVNHLKGDHGCIATTMVNYYGLPRSDERAWPGGRKRRLCLSMRRLYRLNRHFWTTSLL